MAEGSEQNKAGQARQPFIVVSEMEGEVSCHLQHMATTELRRFASFIVIIVRSLALGFKVDEAAIWEVIEKEKKAVVADTRLATKQ